MSTVDRMMLATGANPTNTAKYAAHLTDAMAHFNISKREDAAMFIGQIAHESAYFSRVEELLNYSAERLIAVWPSRFKTLEQAKQYARNPEKLANLVYGGRMGNKDVGDGYRYRGRGLKQLTGRFNYAAATIGLLDQLGVDYEANPDAVIEPKHAAWTAAWFWSWKRLNGLTAQGKFQTVTRIINGGLTDHDKRMNLYQKAMACQ